MKIVCERSSLTTAIAAIARIAPTRTPMPILGCVLIEADADGVRLSAANASVAARIRMDATVLQDGKVAVDAKMLGDVAGRMPEGDVCLTRDDSVLSVTAGRTRIRLGVLDEAAFPAMPEAPANAPDCAVAAAALREAVKKVAFATTADNNNLLLSAIHVVLSDGWMTLTALDGHRIAEWSAPVDGALDVLAPAAELSEAVRIFGGNGEVTLSADRNGLFLESDKAAVRISRIAGDYFDVKRMVQDGQPIRVEVARDALISALERATLFVRENDMAPVVLDVAGTSMKISLESQLGGSEEELDVQKEGPDIRIGFNPKFLLDSLRAVPDETAHIKFVNGRSPVLIEDEEKTYRHIILPVNIH